MKIPPRVALLAEFCALLLCLVVLVSFMWAVQHRGDVDVLPPAVTHAVDAEKAARPSLDSAVAQSRYDADIAHANQLAAESFARQLQRVAEQEGHRADSLAAEARHAATARDSAVMWHLAYAARTSERDTLLVTIDTLRSGLSLAEARGRVLEQGLSISEKGRIRADSVLDATVAAARSATCRVPGTFGLVHCMSRTQAAVVGVAVGYGGKVLVDAVKDGRVKLSLPLP